MLPSKVTLYDIMCYDQIKSISSLWVGFNFVVLCNRCCSSLNCEFFAIIKNKLFM